MEQSVGVSGEAQVTGFTEWVSSKLKERAQVQKQARLYREEFRGRGAGNEAATWDERGRGRGKGGGGGKPKAKPKPAAGPAAAGSV